MLRDYLIESNLPLMGWMVAFDPEVWLLTGQLPDADRGENRRRNPKDWPQNAWESRHVTWNQNEDDKTKISNAHNQQIKPISQVVVFPIKNNRDRDAG